MFNQKNQTGQIMIIAVIMIGVFVAIGASVATQVLFEQRKAILEEKTQKAYYAAESGVEQALQKLYQGQNPDGTNIQIDKSSVDITTGTDPGSQSIKVFKTLASGEGYSLDLSGYSGSEIDICWDKPDVSFIATLVYTDSALLTKRNINYAVNTNSTQDNKIAGSGTYDQSTTPQVISTSTCGSFVDSESSPVSFKITLGLPINDFAPLDFLTIWPLYTGDVQFYFSAPIGNNFPSQGTFIDATAEIKEGENKVVRTVHYFKSSISTPPIYLFSPLFGTGPVNFAPGKNW